MFKFIGIVLATFALNACALDLQGYTFGQADTDAGDDGGMCPDGGMLPDGAPCQ
jgi:hypothetical protein